MNKVERVLAALRGDPVDHVPVGFWGHFLDRESTAEELATSMLGAYRRCGYDFLKVHARASYHAEGWGTVYAPSPDGVAFPKVVNAVISEPEDWYGLPVLEPDKGALGEQLEALDLIKRGLAGEALFLQTVFSPLTVARALVGGSDQTLVRHLREHPAALHQGLSTIVQTFALYVRLCLEVGAAGLFYATTFGVDRKVVTEEEYREFGVPYDLEVLKAAQAGAVFNFLHFCKGNIMFDLLESYPVHCLNWSQESEGNPSLEEGLQRTTKAVAGGIGEKSTIQGPIEEVVAEARRALDETGGRRFLLTGGCSLQTRLTPEANLRAVRETAIAWQAERASASGI